MALVKAVKSLISVATKLIGDTLTHINLTACLICPQAGKVRGAQMDFGGNPVYQAPTCL